MPLPALIQPTDTFNTWFDATNNVISHIANTNAYVLVTNSSSANLISTGNVYVNGAIHTASLLSNANVVIGGTTLDAGIFRVTTNTTVNAISVAAVDFSIAATNTSLSGTNFTVNPSTIFQSTLNLNGTATFTKNVVAVFGPSPTAANLFVVASNTGLGASNTFVVSLASGVEHFKILINTTANAISVNATTFTANLGTTVFQTPSFTINSTGSVVINTASAQVFANTVFAGLSGTGNVAFKDGTTPGAYTTVFIAHNIFRVNATSDLKFDGIATFDDKISGLSSLEITGGAILSSTLSVAANAVFDTNTLYVDAVNNRVGVVTVPAAPYSLDVSGQVRATGDVTVTQGLSVTNAVSFSNTLAVTNAVSFSNTLAVTGSATFSNTIAVTGNATLSQSLTVTNAVSFSNTLVVVGSTNINNTLTVNGAFGTSTESLALKNTTAAAVGNINRINFYAVNTFDGAAVNTARIESVALNAGTRDTDIRLYTASGVAAPSERIRIAANGNIGIANTAPAHGLSVDGTTRLSGAVNALSTLSVGGDATFTGNVNIIGTATIGEIIEKATVIGTAHGSTVTFDTLNNSVLYYTANSPSNWTLNLRGNSSVTLNSLLATNDSITFTVMMTQGSSAYYQNAFTVDGSSVAVKWQNGFAPSVGNPNSIDVYTFALLKTGASTYTVLGAFTKYA